jgi:hypothetical protein
MPIIPTGDYRPDAPAYLGTHATTAANIYPRPDGTDGPLREGLAASASLNSTPVQAFLARGDRSEVYLYASHDNFSWIRRKTGTAWETRYAPSTGVATARFPWRFCQFGNMVVATNPANGTVAHPISTVTNFTPVAGAPAGAFIATIEPGFVMLGNTSDADGTHPSRLHWSGINDHTLWPPPGSTDAASVQSDLQDLPIGGAITGILAAVGGVAGCVLTEQAVYRMEYIGAPAIFAFREVARGVGNVCPNGAIAVNGLAYFVSDEGFMRFDGQSLAPFGQGRVSSFFWQTVDRENLHRVNVAHDPIRKIIVWAYPTILATNGNPDRWLIYSYATDRWRYADITCTLLFTAMLDRVPLDSFDTYFPAGMDGSSVSLDGLEVNGGAPALMSFNTGFALVEHRGPTLPALVDTGETDSNGRRVHVSGIRPLTDAANATASVGYRDTFAAAVAFTALSGPEADGVCKQRINTRYARARIYIPPASTWTYLQGADVQFKAAGKR